jgi:hypothetical protein
MESGLLWKFV